jgi:Na+-driven multidrug efflux pump
MPLSYVLAIVFELGIMGAWIAAAAYVVLLSSIMAWKFYEGKWKQIKI